MAQRLEEMATWWCPEDIEVDLTPGNRLYQGGDTTFVLPAKDDGRDAVVKVVLLPRLSHGSDDVRSNAQRAIRECHIRSFLERACGAECDLFVPVRGAWLREDPSGSGNVAVVTMMDKALCTWHDVVSGPVRGQLTTQHLTLYSYTLLLALSKLHRLDILHRDVKPSNVFLGPHQLPWLGDFGLARQHHAPLAVSETMTHSTKGAAAADVELSDYVFTKGYRAPELMLGAKHYTAAVDAFAAGATLFELCTGCPLVPRDVVRAGSVATLRHLVRFVGGAMPQRDELVRLGASRESIDVFCTDIVAEEAKSKTSGATPLRKALEESPSTPPLRAVIEGLLTLSPGLRLTCIEAESRSECFDDAMRNSFNGTSSLPSSGAAAHHLSPLLCVSSDPGPKDGKTLLSELREAVQALHTQVW